MSPAAPPPERAVVVTLDVDWAPDFVIDHVAGVLAGAGVRATWFLTHPSPAVDRLRERPELFELGIHPNFLPGSSQGATAEEVLRYCAALAPDAVSMRTHSLVQSTPLLAEVLARTGIGVDASLFLPRHTGVQPVVWWFEERPLLRVPHWWEDDFEMSHPAPLWDLVAASTDTPGVLVYDFHPIHVYLNSATMDAYRALKAAVPSLSSASAAQAEPFRTRGPGAGSAFEGLVEHLSRSGGGSRLDQVLAAHAGVLASRSGP